MTERSKPQPESRDAYRAFRTVPTRWLDNDIYGHVNNVVYYAWLDSVVNGHLIDNGALDIHQGSTVGFVVESHCNYFAPLAFPQTIEAGLRVGHMGSSSVRYEVGFFAPGQPLAAASAYFVHVYVDRETQRPVPLAPALRQVVQALLPLSHRAAAMPAATATA